MAEYTINRIKLPNNDICKIQDPDAVRRSGDIMTGNLNLNASNIDGTKANNDVTESKYLSTFNIRDTNNNILSRLESIVHPNGTIGSYWYVRNYDTSGKQTGQKGIRMSISKAGDITYGVDDPAKFRAAIGATFTDIKLIREQDGTFDLDNFRGNSMVGLYYVGSGVTNAPQSYGMLLVASREGAEGFTAQLYISAQGIRTRVYSGSPATWSAWK